MEIHAHGPLPPAGPGRWEYLAVPTHWRAERRQLHDRLLREAVAHARRLAETIERAGHPPTLFALRGNTAVGKTHMATQAFPVLAGALDKNCQGTVNPDLFKPPLAASPRPEKLSSAQVHAESLVLAERLEERLASLKTRSGAAASLVVDRRMVHPHQVDARVRRAEQTGRTMNVCDVDAPLEQSLARVLQRDPGGDAPRPPYEVVARGFSAARRHRPEVIDQLRSRPDLATYRLFGSTGEGPKLEVASVADGKLSIHHPLVYERITTDDPTIADRLAGQVIDPELIGRLVGRCDGPAAALCTALQRYAGLTWAQALDAHSTLA